MVNLKRYAVISPFGAWSPVDRSRVDCRISIAPGSRHIFTDGTETTGRFVKFLRSGAWYETEWSEFERSTELVRRN
jgi:hypothetical protein